jgi:hypothetical protein
VGLDDYVNEDGSIGPRKPAPAREEKPRPAQPAPAVDLKPINDRLGNLEGLIRNLSQSREIPQREASSFADPTPAPKQSTPQPTAVAKHEARPGGLASSWGSVLSVLGQVALTAAAPHVALPAGALGVAGFLFRQLRNRSGAGNSEPRQIVRQETVREVPVVVATQAPPPPQQVVTQNQYVPVDIDTHADAYTWASAELVKQYPGAQGTVAMLGSLIEQHKAAHGGFTNGNK